MGHRSHLLNNPALFRFYSLILFCVWAIHFPPSAFAQSSQDTWSGQAQCQLSVQSASYFYQEVQTWAITGPPTSGTMVYPATWSVTGQGQRQDAAATTTATSWKTNVPPTSAPLAILVNSANQLIIKSYHAQLRANNAATGSRQVMLAGVPQSSTPVSFGEYEWQFPVIEVDPTLTDVSGTNSTPANTTIGPSQPPGLTGTANCSWHFSKGAPPTAVPAIATLPLNAQAANSSPVTMAPAGVTNRAVLAPGLAAPAATNASTALSGASSVSANASPNVQTTTPQPSTMSCSHLNSIPPVPTSAASGAASHAYNTDCLGSFGGGQYVKVASLSFAPGHYFLIAAVTTDNFSTSTLSQQYYSCNLAFSWNQSTTAITSGGGTGPVQATLMSLTVNGSATSAEVDCVTFPNVTASAHTSIVAIEVGAMN